MVWTSGNHGEKKVQQKTMTVIYWAHTERSEVTTHNDTILFVGLHADSSDVTDIYATQRTEEAGLAVLMTREQLFVCYHQATWDAWSGGHTLRDDLQGR